MKISILWKKTILNMAPRASLKQKASSQANVTTGGPSTASSQALPGKTEQEGETV